MKLNIALYLKVDFVGTGHGYGGGFITGTGEETHMEFPVF